MGVEFQLGYTDHKSVEDFMLRRPAGVTAITLHAKAARHQQGAAEAAREGGAEVYFNPATERLVAPGYELPGAPYYSGSTVFDVDQLAADQSARLRLIEGVLKGHPTFTTKITPPHFYVHSERSASLNVVLAADTILSTDRPVRAVLVLDRRFGVKTASDLAKRYHQAGITHLELRLTPFGGEDESLAKIKSGFRILDAFREAGIATTLGLSGTVGHAAVAFGHADHYSVGVGQLEQVSHSTTISAQQRPPKFDENGKKKSGGSGDGIYLPGIAQTLSRKVAKKLLGHSDIRLRLGCRLEGCAASVAGPAADPRRHYLHARAKEMDDLLQRPAPWRPTMEIDRFGSALALRELINRQYQDGLPADLKTRTLRSIVDLGQAEQAAQSA